MLRISRTRPADITTIRRISAIRCCSCSNTVVWDMQISMEMEMEMRERLGVGLFVSQPRRCHEEASLLISELIISTLEVHIYDRMLMMVGFVPSCVCPLLRSPFSSGSNLTSPRVRVVSLLRSVPFVVSPSFSQFFASCICLNSGSRARAWIGWEIFLPIALVSSCYRDPDVAHGSESTD